MKVTRFGRADASAFGSGSPSGAAGGDLGGSFPAPSVSGIQGVPICTDAPALNDVLTFDGTEWCPAPGGGSGGSFLTTTLGEQHALYVASASGAVTLDCSLANTFDLTLTGNVTYSITNPPPPGVDSRFTVIRRQGGVGSFTETWPASVTWPNTTTGVSGGSAPTLYTAVGAVDVVEISTEDGGVTWGGSPKIGASPLTTKGDLFGHSSVDARVPVGTDGQVLTADSTATLGVSYQTPVSVGPQHVHVDNVTFSGDGSTTAFILPAAPVDAYSVAAYVAGVRLSVTLSGTLLDVMTFASAPASATDNIIVDIAAAL